MIDADLVADDDADADAERAPERRRRERAEAGAADWPPLERRVDAAAGEDAEPIPKREPLADHAEHEPGEQARDELGGQTTRERRGVKRNVGRIVP